jgi:uncharacterized protein YbjT (DUF2867 family)
MYLVTGATGNVGGAVVADLLAKKEDVRVFTRDQRKVAHWGNQVEIAVGDFNRPDTFATAADGVKAVFLMNGGPDGASVRKLVAAAKSKGQPKIVFLSTILADSSEFSIGKLHKEKEDAIRDSGLEAQSLRPGGFMSNAFMWIKSIKSAGVVYNAMGTGKSAPIAPEDIAAVAVDSLTTRGIKDEVLELTGGSLLSIPEQVQTLSKILGAPIRCEDISISQAVDGMVEAGIPDPIARAVAQSYEAVREGRGARLTDTVLKVKGRPPISFEDWVRKHIARFK